MDAFAEGYAFFAKNAGAYSAAEMGGTYVGDVEAEIKKFADLLNEKFSDNHAGIDQLKGNVAEFWTNCCITRKTVLQDVHPGNIRLLYTKNVGGIFLNGSDNKIIAPIFESLNLNVKAHYSDGLT